MAVGPALSSWRLKGEAHIWRTLSRPELQGAKLHPCPQMTSPASRARALPVQTPVSPPLCIYQRGNRDTLHRAGRALAP